LPNKYIYAVVEVASFGKLILMKLSFLKSIFLSAAFLIIPSTSVLASDGYWKGGYWCSQENNYCRENWGSGHNHDRYWSSPND